MSKQQYRTEMGIIGDILRVIVNGGRKGVIVSKLSLKANVSYYAAIDKCEKLISAGLVKLVKNDKNRVYIATESGIKFFQEFQNFQFITGTLKLRF